MRVARNLRARPRRTPGILPSCALGLAVLCLQFSLAAQDAGPPAQAVPESHAARTAPTPAPAESTTRTTPITRATPAPHPLKIGGVTLSGSLRVRAEHYRWFETPGFDDTYTFGAAVLRLSLGQQRERFDWQVEGAFPVLLNLPERATAPAPQGALGLGANYFAASRHQNASAILKQAFVRFKRLFGDSASALRAGRFEFTDGMETTPANPTLAALKRDHIAHRLLGPFGFTHVGRSFDAVQYVRHTASGNFTFVGGRPTEGVFQLRAIKELDVDFWYAAFTKPFAGRRFTGDARALALHYHDGRGALKTDNRALALRRADQANIRITTLGGHLAGVLQSGRGTWDWLAWGVAQFGSWGRLQHRAGAFVIEGGLQPATGWLARNKVWLRAGYSFATGDRDANDSRHTTFFQILPTPRWTARFPFYNMMNTRDLYAQLKLRPHARLNLRAEVHRLSLSSSRDLWYTGGGAFQESSFGYAGRAGGGPSSLGTLFDLSADWSLTPTTTLSFYGAGVRGGGVPRGIYPAGGAHPAARLLYAELVKRF